MLQFWKKSGPSNKNYETSRAPYAELGSPGCSDSPKPSPLVSFDDEGLCDIDEFESTKERSRLSKTLDEVLSDKSALGYFLQYMECKGASAYILCWLDVDTFKCDVQQSKDTSRKTPSMSPVPNYNKVDHDSLSVSTDCDSYTADTNSLYECSSATVSDSKVTHVAVDTTTVANGYCDRDASDTSPKLRSSTESSMDDKKTGQHLIDSALMIFKKYIAQEATSPIKCGDLLRNEVVENVCDTEKILTGHCFDKVQSYVHDLMEKEYFEAFLGSDYYCKRQIDVLTSGNVALDDLLYNETALFYFMEYLEQEGARNLLDFWVAATNLHQQLHDQKEFYDPVEAQNDAVVLYDKYFSLQAHCPLGFGDKIRFAVEQSICGENGLVLDCFHLPLKLVEQVIERNYLKSFLASQLYYKYLSELINTVQSSGYLAGVENCRESPSDCSSERSFSTNSTFLALDMTPNSIKKTGKVRDMSISTRELCDPDSLWKRKHNHSLSCGRITALGKFETDLQPEPSRREFKLKNMVRKFVSLEEDKKKEEMAWQVAEMIVKDITSVTMNSSRSGSMT